MGNPSLTQGLDPLKTFCHAVAVGGGELLLGDCQLNKHAQEVQHAFACSGLPVLEKYWPAGNSVAGNKRINQVAVHCCGSKHREAVTVTTSTHD